MVGYDPSRKNFTQKEQFAIGAASSLTSRFFVQPLDVLKIRFQLQHEAISRKSVESKYQSIPQSVATIFKEEGLFGFWKGHLSAQILSVAFVTTEFLWFQQLTYLTYLLFPSTYDEKIRKLKPLSHFICGGVAGGLTVLTSQPLDVVRTRLVAQGEPKHYRGINDAFRNIIKYEGFKGLYKGTVPCILFTAPEAAFRFGIYQFLNNHWRKSGDYLKSHEIGVVQSTINGGLAGVAAKTIVYPFDLIKKRLQIQGFEFARKNFGKTVKSTGLVQCLILTIREEGFLGLYKGYLPSLIKAWVSSGLVFLFYEQFSNLTRRINKKD